MSSFISREGLEVLQLEELLPFGIDAFLTTRAGGVSGGPYESLNLGLHVGDNDANVIANRERVATSPGLGLDDMVFADQIHGTRIAVVNENDAGRGARNIENAFSATDALITTAVNVPLVILVADCCPIVMIDSKKKILAVIHAGWRGTASGITTAVVEKIEELGGSRIDLRVVIGPSVDLARYEVGIEVVDALSKGLPTNLITFVDHPGQKPHVDVAGAARAHLIAAGVSADTISIVTPRTDDVRFFSDRTDRPCGRFGLIARLIS